MIETGPRWESASLTARRILAGVVAVPFTIYALMLAAGLISAWRFDPIGICLLGGAGTIGALCWWFALWGHVPESRARLRITLAGGFILGGIGFLLGFFGPLILQPGANQGPLLGILVTGPIGFVLGVVAGWLYARFRTARPRAS